VRQDALQSGAGSQIQKRLVLGAEFDPFREYAPGINHFLPSNIHYHFAREPLTQPWREPDRASFQRRAGDIRHKNQAREQEPDVVGE
jgi:hypothetical protein